MRNHRQKIVFGLAAIAALMALYVGTYAFNSVRGGYGMIPERDGRDLYKEGWPATTAILWQPARGRHTPFRATGFGRFYSPLIVLDRQFVHPTRYLFDEGTWEWLQALPIEEMHPSCRDEARSARRQKEAVNKEPEATR